MIIELRINPGKFKISSLMSKVANQCMIPTNKVYTVPHLAVCSNIKPDNADRVISVLENLGDKYCKGVTYVIDGFCNKDEEGKEIYFNILPSKDLVRLQSNISKHLGDIAPNKSPCGEDSAFQITLCSNLSDYEAEQIMTHISKPPKDKPQFRPIGCFYFHFTSLRLALLGHDYRTICEYDLIQAKMLSSKEATTEDSWKKTFCLYRQRMDFEMKKIMHSKTPQKYLIGDLHLDHENIIRYCARPFVDVDEMNQVLVDNWNRIVNPRDTIYFLGDMTFGRRSRGVSFWLEKLNGNLVFIKGNHDKKIPKAVTHHILEHGKYKFLLVHDPNELPIPWNDWIIHGDKHNNDMRNYPFINKKKKTINVSCEVTGYKPLNIEHIIQQIEA